MQTNDKPCRWTEQQIEAAARALCVRYHLDPDALEPGNTPYNDETEVIDGESRSGESAFLVWRLYACDALTVLDAAFPCHEPQPSVVKESLTAQPDPTPDTCRWWRDEYTNWCCGCSDTMPDFTPWTGTDPNGCFCPNCGKIITVRVHDKP